MYEEQKHAVCVINIKCVKVVFVKVYVKDEYEELYECLSVLTEIVCFYIVYRLYQLYISYFVYQLR
jgi:hypothetical protein